MRHELYLARAGFAGLAAVSIVAVVAGAAIAGRAGAASAALGAGLVAANHGVAVLSTAWSRKLGIGVMAVGYSVFALRMLLVLAAFAGLQTLPWIHSALLAAAFCAALVATLSAECVSYVRGTYVPGWMRRQAPVSIGASR